MKDEKEFIEMIKKSFDRECTDGPEIKYLVELPMTKEEYDIFIKIIDNK
jgi:hypothetical protein